MWRDPNVNFLFQFGFFIIRIFIETTKTCFPQAWWPVGINSLISKCMHTWKENKLHSNKVNSTNSFNLSLSLSLCLSVFLSLCLAIRLFVNISKCLHDFSKFSFVSLSSIFFLLSSFIFVLSPKPQMQWWTMKRALLFLPSNTPTQLSTRKSKQLI